MTAARAFLQRVKTWKFSLIESLFAWSSWNWTYFFSLLGMHVCTVQNSVHPAQTRISKPVKQEVNRTVILPLWLFPGITNDGHRIIFENHELFCNGRRWQSRLLKYRGSANACVNAPLYFATVCPSFISRSRRFKKILFSSYIRGYLHRDRCFRWHT